MKRLTERLEDGRARAKIADYGEPPYPIVTNDFIETLVAYEDTGLTPEEFKESVDFVLNLNAKLHNVANYLIKEYTNKYEYYDTDSYWNNGAVEALEELLRRLHE